MMAKTNIYKKILLILLLTTVGLYSCKSDSNEISPKVIFDQYSFPFKEGQENEYYVKTQDFLLRGPKKDSFYIKDVVQEINNNGLIATIKIQRFKKSFDGILYQPFSLLSYSLTNGYLLRNENNSSLQVLNFPLTKNTIWDGNQFNTSPKDDFSVKEISNGNDSNQTITNTAFDLKNILTTEQLNKCIIQIKQEDSINLIKRDIRYEKYLEGVGLIEQNYVEVTLCFGNEDGCERGGQIKAGTTRTQYLIGFKEGN